MNLSQLTLYNVACQAIGILAMLIMVSSFQLKKPRAIIFTQFFASIFFCVHFALLGAVMGTFLNFVAMIRAYVYSHREKFHAEHIGWLFFFFALFVVGYIATFTILDKEPTVKNLILELLPVIGMVAGTIGFRIPKASTVRSLSLINAPAWLIYNIFNGSIGGSISDSMSMISLIIGKIRLDWKK